MFDAQHLPTAVAHLLNTPISYNPFYAHALESTKAAILLDFVLQSEASGEGFPTHRRMMRELSLSQHEVKTLMNMLLLKRVLVFRDGTWQVEPFYLETLGFLAQENGRNEQLLAFDWLRSVDISRLDLFSIKDAGGSVNAVILFSLLYDDLSESDRVNHPIHSEWMHVHDDVWMALSGMGQKELRNAKQSLKSLGLIETRKQGFPGKVMYRLNLDLHDRITWQYTLKEKPKSNATTTRAWLATTNTAVAV